MRVHHDGQRHDAAGYVGARPTFGEGAPVLEAYLFHFAGDLYGAEVEAEFIAFLRPDQIFASAAQLAAQMEKDCDAARTVLRQIDQVDPMRRFPLGRALAEADTGLS